MPKVQDVTTIPTAHDVDGWWGHQGGVSVGTTDELGSRAVDDRFHVKHLHATALHLMGLDPNKLPTSTEDSTVSSSA